jgi:hypothetical protein
MTGYQSKRAAALDEEGMYLVHHTKRKDDDDDVQVYQRPWVGLTAEEAAECWTTSATQTWKNFEAKLREKNT